MAFFETTGTAPVPTLGRVSGVPCSVEEASLNLAKDAQNVLGYNVLSVAQVFRRLGIEPLDLGQVDAYKHYIYKAAGSEYRSWQSTKLEEYGLPIPEFVLSRALEIKREIPNAQFYVEDFREHPDPFLYMQVGRTRYYLDVWDEPKFEGRRTI